jgi:hypothetical protein
MSTVEQARGAQLFAEVFGLQSSGQIPPGGSSAFEKYLPSEVGNASGPSGDGDPVGFGGETMTPVDGNLDGFGRKELLSVGRNLGGFSGETVSPVDDNPNGFGRKQLISVGGSLGGFGGETITTVDNGLGGFGGETVTAVDGGLNGFGHKQLVSVGGSLGSFGGETVTPVDDGLGGFGGETITEIAGSADAQTDLSQILAGWLSNISSYARQQYAANAIPDVPDTQSVNKLY